MKTIRFFAIAILLMAAVSCANDKADDPQDDGKTGIVSLVINTGELTRAESVPAEPGTYVTVDPATTTVYFMSGVGNIVASRLLTAADDIDDVNGIYTFESVPSTAKSLYVVCNEGTADITYASKTNISGIKSGYGAFGPITAEYDALMMSNANETTPTDTDTSKAVPLTLLTAATPGVLAVYEATVDLAPVVARLELGQIEAIEGIDSYTLKGIYLDDHFPNFTVGALANGTQMVIGQDPAKLTGFNSYMCDVYPTPLASTESLDLTQVVNAGTDACWAWQVPTGVPSRIILVLGDVVVEGVEEEVDKYISVRGYRDVADAVVTSFERGKVYHISNLTFNADDLGDTPNADPIDVIATLEVLPWEVISIIPVL